MKKLFLLVLIFCSTSAVVLGQNMLANPGFEEGADAGTGVPIGWIGYAQTGASMEFINDAGTAYAGNNWVKVTSTNGGYYLLYQATFAATPGQVWEFSSFIKDVSPADPGASFAALKISAKNSSGSTFKAWEVYYNDVTTDWTKFSNIQIMPEGTASIQAVIVVHGADGALEASYGFDDLSCEVIYESPESPTEYNWLANPGFENGVDTTTGVPTGWIGYAQSGASMEVLNDKAGAVNGNYWTKCGSTTTGYYLLYQQTFAANPGETWRFSSFIKDVSDTIPPAPYVFLKISAKSITGSTFLAYEIEQDATTYWKKFTNVQTMPEGTAYIQAVIVVNPPDGITSPVYYGFDDVSLTRDTVLPVPVELTSLKASVNDNNVELKWQTATELNNKGFEIQRKFGKSDFITIGFINGVGTTTEKTDYSYADKNLSQGKYLYRLRQLDFDGQYKYSQTVEVDIQVLDQFSLKQNYPNPWNPNTTIEYVIPEETNVKLTIINALGQEVSLLVNETQEKGLHKVMLDGSKLSSGIYFYRISAGNFTETKKMLLLK